MEIRIDLKLSLYGMLAIFVGVAIIIMTVLPWYEVGGVSYTAMDLLNNTDLSGYYALGLIVLLLGVAGLSFGGMHMFFDGGKMIFEIGMIISGVLAAILSYLLISDLTADAGTMQYGFYGAIICSILLIVVGILGVTNIMKTHE